MPPMQVRTVALASLRTLHPLLYQSGSWPDSGVFEGFLEKSFTKGLLTEWEGLWELQMDGRDEQKQEPEGAKEGQRHYQPWRELHSGQRPPPGAGQLGESSGEPHNCQSRTGLGAGPHIPLPLSPSSDLLLVLPIGWTNSKARGQGNRGETISRPASQAQENGFERAKEELLCIF